MKEEKELIERVGRQNPFRVPEDYFDTLTAQVMAKVDAEGAQPSSPRRARILWLRPVLYAAACICALCISVATLMPHDRQGMMATADNTVVAQSTEDAFDEAADYVMVDNQEIYACLSSDY